MYNIEFFNKNFFVNQNKTMTKFMPMIQIFIY